MASSHELADQLTRHGALSDARVADAIRSVPRHLFLPDHAEDEVYSDVAIVTRRDATGMPCSSSSQPAIVAVMLEQLEVQPGHRVLEIGAGTGWNAALLAWLARPSGRVTTIDLDDDIVVDARAHLGAAGVDGVDVITGDGWIGHPEAAPFDRIVVTVGVADLSPHWVEQLAPGGRIVVPLRLAWTLQLSVAFAAIGHRLASASVRPCGFMQLRGPHAADQRHEQDTALASIQGIDNDTPLDVTSLSVEAIPMGADGDPARGYTRPNYTFVVTAAERCG